MSEPGAPATRYEFGPFVFEPQRRRLLRDGAPVALGARAMDLLQTLLDHPGRILDRETLVRRVWPRTVVEDSSLRVQVAALRRALDDAQGAPRFISTVPGRGYGFIGTVRRAVAETGAAHRETPHNLPPRLEAVIGRGHEVDEVAGLLVTRRLVSLVGAGGIGKTTVALAVARSLLPAFAEGVRFVDLSPVEKPETLMTSVAVALGVLAPGDAPWPMVLARLQQRQLLLLDNCEHLGAAVRDFAAMVLEAAPRVHLLVTSRMPLAVHGEHPVHLAPLATGDEEVDVARPPAAIALFAERARAMDSGFELTAGSARKVQQICRQLDGLPLAVELAAARVGALGLNGLAEQLDGVLQLATWGRRAGPTRHRTLQSLMDWSYMLLAPDEQALLRRLSVFRGTFQAEDAVATATGPGLDAAAAKRCLQRLIERSLVASAEPGSSGLRLLYVTRAYAQDQLEAAGEFPTWARRQAELLTLKLQQAGDELCALMEQELPVWHRRHAGLLDDLRAACDRSFGPGGHRPSGIALLAAARRTVMHFGLYAEFMPRMRRALQALDEMDQADPALELPLCVSVMFIGIIAGLTPDERSRLEQRITALRPRAATQEQQVDALYAVASNAWSHGDHDKLTQVAAELREVLGDDRQHPAWALLGERLRAIAGFYAGRLRQACQLFLRVQAYPRGRLHPQYIGHTPRDVLVGHFLTRAYWIMGRNDDATRLLEQMFALVDEMMPLTLSNLLGQAAIPIALWQGDDRLAGERLDRLADHAHRHRQAYWQPMIEGYRAILARRAGRGAEEPLAPVLPPHALAADLFATFGPEFLTEATLQRAREGRIGWCSAEVLRADAVRRLRQGEQAPQARRDLQAAWQLARRQGALAWELRAACSLLRHAPPDAPPEPLRERLAICLQRAVQGPDTADVAEARSLLGHGAAPLAPVRQAVHTAAISPEPS
ncbi:ATP-binding protein [Rubrivivax sp. RP6-9]|uniref:ATP-binding protein n=1 Tax=Rubrivivax sp. RP6-9 TaxID=3415750 RepID=UPI003CC54F48